MKYIRTKRTAFRGLFFFVAPVLALTIPILFLAPMLLSVSLVFLLLGYISFLALHHLRLRSVEITPTTITVTRGFRRELTDSIRSDDIADIAGVPSGGWRIKKKNGQLIGLGLMCFSEIDRKDIAQHFVNYFAKEGEQWTEHKAEPIVRGDRVNPPPQR